jgi:hypothetical protein
VDRFLLYMVTTLAAAGVVVFLARRLSRSPLGGSWWVALPALAAYGILVAWRPGGILLGNSAVIAAAVLLAALIGTKLGSVAALIAFSVAAATADLLSFFGGPTRVIAESFQDSATDLLPYLAVTLPLAERLVPVVGLGDLAVLGILSLALSLQNASGAVAFVVPVAGLLAGLVLGILGSGAPGIPFMAVAVLGFLGLERWRLRH